MTLAVRAATVAAGHPKRPFATNPVLQRRTPFSPPAGDRHYTARHTFT
jgi:hypothetical protein